MQLDRLQVELRPRSPWEAMELGAALLRRHSGLVWRAWLLASLPAFALFNAIAWLLDSVWMAGLAMWWLKPAFDRVPLYVLSRVAFGHVPGVRESAAALWRFGPGRLLRDLTWGRLSPYRALLLPVALLEGVRGARLRARSRVIAGRGSAAGLLLLLCIHFEIVMTVSMIGVGMLLVPTEYLGESARAIYALMFRDPPLWAQLLLNGIGWTATTLIEPFYVAAGFGLYLNRRTELEGWDIEIALRRLSQRLRTLAAAGALLVCVLLVGAPAHAQATQQSSVAIGKAPAAAKRTSLESVFAAQAQPADDFVRASQQAYRDPLLRPKKVSVTWQLRDRDRPPPNRQRSRRWSGLPFMADIIEVALWVGLAALLLWALWRLPRWWPQWWMWRQRERAPAPQVQETAAPHMDALPDDIAGAARTLWAQGKPRAALALLYRASVAAIVRIGAIELPPGATEAQCLRASRRLPQAEDRSAFDEVVRAWQYAAYAQRLPDAAEFERLLARTAQRFGWSA